MCGDVQVLNLVDKVVYWIELNEKLGRFSLLDRCTHTRAANDGTRIANKCENSYRFGFGMGCRASERAANREILLAFR